MIDPQTGEFTWFGVALLCGLVFGGAWVAWFLLAKRPAAACPFCRSIRTLKLGDADPITRERILEGYRKREDREPNPRLMQLCPDCHVVIDDFSSFWKGLDGRNPLRSPWCKQCGHLMDRNEFTDTALTCGFCRTSSAWQQDDASGCIVFRPVK